MPYPPPPPPDPAAHVRRVARDPASELRVLGRYRADRSGFNPHFRADTDAMVVARFGPPVQRGLAPAVQPQRRPVAFIGTFDGASPGMLATWHPGGER